MVLWVFGYGSLIWNPGFEFDEKIIGYIKNYKRAFNLACLEHMGTPDRPARTLTLESSDGSKCWGTAFCVRGGVEKERLAMEYLERRESEYDLKTRVDFCAENGDQLRPAVEGVLVFTSTPDRITNKYYLGPAPLEEMARQIATASGPCGNNREYLFKLEKALFDIVNIVIRPSRRFSDRACESSEEIPSQAARKQDAGTGNCAQDTPLSGAPPHPCRNYDHRIQIAGNKRLWRDDSRRNRISALNLLTAIARS